MAVTGLPDPTKAHAVTMAHFAAEIRAVVRDQMRDLEVALGPGTSDLRIRIGMHSWPVTAGVLRGQKSRFQLFGDTVNISSRMESMGQAGRIRVPQATADLLIEGGLQDWLLPREVVRSHIVAEADSCVQKNILKKLICFIVLY
jgi:class 3 adenylate cyclase